MINSSERETGIAQRDVLPAARKPRMMRGAAIMRNGFCLGASTRTDRADGDRKRPMAIAWN
jgi:hypothetical protein